MKVLIPWIKPIEREGLILFDYFDHSELNNYFIGDEIDINQINKSGDHLHIKEESIEKLNKREIKAKEKEKDEEKEDIVANSSPK